VSSKNKTR